MNWRQALDTSQSIFAVASGKLPSAIAILRLSGVDAPVLASRLFKSVDESPWQNVRGMFYGKLVSSDGAHSIDDILLLNFKAPHSHTGENLVEFHCHGSVAVVEKLAQELVKLGARPAARGEFSYRALLNGKTTPQELENLGDVFLAQSPVDLERIYGRREESLQALVSGIRARLIAVQAILDTAVDFSEEYSEVVATSLAPISLVIHECSQVIQRYENFGKLGAVPRLVLGGKPNAGKSSLFNALLGRYRAIVHPDAGTTRDVIEEYLSIGGHFWKLADTAGLRVAADETEQSGIALGTDFLHSASLCLFVVDGTSPVSELKKLESLLEQFSGRRLLLVWNKADLPEWKVPPEPFAHLPWVGVSARTGENLPLLWKKLEAIAPEVDQHGEFLPTASQVAKLRFVNTQLAELLDSAKANELPEYLAEKNRLALSRLESLLGEVTADDVLDRIFGEFCIGK